MSKRYPPYPPYGYDPYFYTQPQFKSAREEIEEWEEWLNKRKKELAEKEKEKKHRQGMGVTDWLLVQAFLQPFLVLAYIHFIGKLLKP